MSGEHETSAAGQHNRTLPVRPNSVGTPICIGAPVVSGLGEDEILERVVVDLTALTAAAITAGILPPGITFRVAEAVVLSKRVSIDECEVFTNKVLVNGTLHKDILFKFVPTTAPILTTGVVTTGDCSAVLARTVDVVLDCPFGACIPVMGACPGDTCVIENACIDAEKDLLIDTNFDTIPELFEEKVCILIQAKTLRQTNITITPTLPNICPPTPTTPACPSPPCPPTVGLPTTTFVSRRGPGVFPPIVG
jgi:hypothetical protein